MRVNITNDEYMKYDIELHQYVLLPVAGIKFLGLDVDAIYNNQQIANAELTKQSMQVYDWMYSKILTGQKRNVEFLIATGGEYREAIFKALLGQLEYAVESRGNEVSKHHGISLSKGTYIPTEVIRGDVQVSLRTVQAITNAGLLYNGVYRWSVSNSIYRKGY